MTIETLRPTLGNQQWLEQNIPKLKALLPETWTHAQNFNLLAFGYKLKLLGVMWTDMDDLLKIMKFLNKAEILQGEGFLIRANPNR